MGRKEFKEQVKRHDWYFEYSDDHRVWTRGRKALGELKMNHAALECPFDLQTLCKWAHNMILEQFSEEKPGEYYRQPRKYKYIAPTRRDDLITQEEFDAIETWMDGNESE